MNTRALKHLVHGHPKKCGLGFEVAAGAPAGRSSQSARRPTRGSAATKPSRRFKCGDSRITILALGICVMLSGCAPQTNQKEARQLAEKRFNHQKARIKCSLALGQFENGQVTKARETVREAIALDPEDHQAYLLLARIHIEQGRLSQAKQLLDLVIAEHVPNPEAHYQSGVVAERYGRPDQAVESYREAHELSPRESKYLMAYGELLISLNDAEEACYLIEENLQGTDNYARLMALYGEALHILGRHGEAANAFRQAMIESPRDHSLLESYGMSLFHAGRFADAMPPLKRLLSEYPDHMPLHALQALSRCALKANDQKAALTYLRRITRHDPQDVQAWLMIAQCNVRLDRFTDAQHAAERAAELDSSNNTAQTTLAYVLIDQKRWSQARRVLATAFENDPDDVVVLCLLGQVLEANGAPERAVEYYKRAIIAAPNDPLAVHSYENLRKKLKDDARGI